MLHLRIESPLAFIRKNIYRILLFGILVCGAFLRLARIGGPSLWYDELYTVRVSTGSLGSVIPEALASRHPPLYYLSLHFWTLINSGDSWIRLLSAGAGIATIAFVFAIGRDLFSRRAGLFGAAFVAVSPFMIWYSRDATDYSWAIVTTIASFYFLIKAAQRGGWLTWSLYIATSAAALFTHYYNVLFLLAEIPLFLLLWKRPVKLRAWLLAEAALAAVLLPWLLMLNEAKAYAQGSLPNLKAPPLRAFIDGILTAPITFIKGYAGLMGRGESALFLNGLQKIIIALGLLAAIAFIIYAKRYISSEIRRKLLVLTGFLFFIISLPVFMQMAQGELVAGRYYAVASPIFFILLAAIVSSLPSRLSWVISGLIIIMLVLFLNIERQGIYQEDWRGIMNVVASKTEVGDEILCFPFYNCVVAQEHYGDPDHAQNLPVKGGVVSGDQPQDVYLFPPDYVWAGYKSKLPDVNKIDDASELEQQLALEIKDSNRLWLVAGTGNLGNYPNAKVIEELLSDDWDLQQEWSFTPLNLKLYARQ